VDSLATRQGVGGKPVDVGNGSLAASFGRTNAALLAILAPHPDHGTVELSAVPPFDERHRGDPTETRRHRARLAEDRFACVWLETTDGAAFRADEVDLADPLRPVWRGIVGSASVQASAAADPGGIVLIWQAEAAGAPLPPVRLRFEGRLDRPALAEITEIDPPSPTGATTVLRARGQSLDVVAAELPATMTIEAEDGAWLVEGDAARLDVPWPRGEARVTTSIRCSSGAARPVRAPASFEALPLGDVPLHRLVTRALAYVRGCTALATAADERVILTDHRILPLSWTRDAYFQALLLLAADGVGDRDRVADHLRWLWRRCERPDDRWVRSHHADGRRKDRAFQADQQLYPILELADFWRRTRSLPDGVDWSHEVAGAWSATLSEVDPRTGLLACAENAADDPAPAPFLAGSQIMLWYAASRLRELADDGVLDLDAGALAGVAQGLRAAFDRTLPEGDRWAYAADGAGGRVAYHDANDLPTALAPLWGFCPTDDPAWRATMNWAFSTANPGYYTGERSGLGSVHTAGPWTLGDIQRWLVARAVGDGSAAGRALERLRAVAFDDGMLPEAYGADGPDDFRVRHWFAWPGAAIAALLILDARGEIEPFLRA